MTQRNDGSRLLERRRSKPNVSASKHRKVMIFFGDKSLRYAVGKFLSHYHRERNHQGLDNELIDVSEEVGRVTGDVCCRQRLGGMLRYYYRAAA
jgi:hypothetical protein